MDLVLALVWLGSLLLVLGILTLLARTIRRDGYGQRPGPRSHPDWTDLPYRTP